MTATNTTPLDAATVQRCIDALKGSGVYRKEWRSGELNRYAELIETWTYTTHPMDILKDLLPPPEKTEAEKLVDKWIEKAKPAPIGVGNMADLIRFAQFALDSLEPPTEAPQEEAYVFGPWIDWPNGPPPKIPHGWEYQMTGTETGYLSDVFIGPDTNSAWHNTNFRYCFRQNTWYNWRGGDCPVKEDTQVAVRYADGSVTRWPGDAYGWEWEHHHGQGNIIEFKIVAPE